MRLSALTLGQMPADVARFGYDRAAQATGIVHFGIGAFHRSHQAWYTDRAMDAGDRDWMIAGVSLRSAGVAEQMNPQDGLYTIAERSAAGTAPRLVGSVREVLVAPHSRARLAGLLADRATHIASFTVTEKGYCRAGDGSLDLALADSGFYPILTTALRERRDGGLPGLTLLSCDNLADNGRQLARLMGEFLAARAPDLAAWFEAECACPSTMVDRIVPATTEADRAMVRERLGGLADEAAVMTEPFSQWVIEDRFAGPRPAWEKVGAELVGGVVSYETAKLRMLNGAHSALAYLGLRRGHAFVHEAVGDPALRPSIEQLMRGEALPTIAAAPGQDLDAYAAALLDRFANPALEHRLIQIAMDGSQKIPQRWLETLAANRTAGRNCPVILAGLGAWLAHIRGDNGAVDDPLAGDFAALWQAHDALGVARALFGPRGRFAATWTANDEELGKIAAGAG